MKANTTFPAIYERSKPCSPNHVSPAPPTAPLEGPPPPAPQTQNLKYDYVVGGKVNSAPGPPSPPFSRASLALKNLPYVMNMKIK